MAKLVKESTGFWTAPDGTRAVSMLRSLPHTIDGFRRFQYRNTPLQPIITIEWPEDVAGEANAIALVPAGVAESLLQHGYARQPKDTDVARWNAAWEPPANAPNSTQDGQDVTGGGEGGQNPPPPSGDAPTGAQMPPPSKPQTSKGSKQSGKK